MKAPYVALSFITAVAVMAPPRGSIAETVSSIPPGSFVATAEPVYYDNHAVYFYLYHWRYRDARGWHFYDTEPALLRDRRMHSPPARWFYGDANETMASTAAPGAP